MGVVLFHMLTGAPPFEGDSSQEIVSRHLHEPVPVAALDRDRVPRWLSDIILACLAKHPDDRLPSARAVLDALRTERGVPGRGDRLSGEDTAPTRALPVARRWMLRRRLAIGGGLLAATGLLWALAGRGKAAQESARTLGNPARPEAVAPLLPTALVIENRLAQPIALSVGDTDRTIPAGDSVHLPLDPGRPLEAHWAMVKPAAAGRMLGREIEGTILSSAVDGELRRAVDARSGDTLRFAPTVLNLTRRPLRVSVIGDRDSADCRCTVPPGDSVRLGYYLFSPRSAVRVRNDRGRTARFDSLGDDVDESSGAVSIVVRQGDLRSK